MVTSQTSGASETVDINNLPDIEAEQRALASSEAAATKQIEANAAANAAANGPQQIEAKPAETEELTPAARQAAEAQKKEEASETLSIDDFMAQKNRATAKAVKPTTAAEAAKVPASPTPVKTTEATTQAQPRDVSVLPPEYHDIAKKMSNDAFAEFTKLVNERQQLTQALAEAKKGALPDNYYEHESAYVLTPEFAQASQIVTEAEQVLNHWVTQADALASGATEYSVLQRDSQGNLVVSAPIKADRNTVNQVNRIVNGAQIQLANAQAQLRIIGDNHRQRAAEAKGWLDGFDKQAFGIFHQKPELQTLVKDTIQKSLHKAYHNNPLAPLLAKAFIVMKAQADQLAAATKGAPATAAAKPAQQPSAATIAGGGAAPVGAKGTETEVTIDMFNAAKKGLL